MSDATTSDTTPDPTPDEPAAGKAAPRQLLPRAERQASILAAAAQAFAEAGYAGTSMDDVAAAAGVSKLIVYRHFDSKEELYRSVLTAAADRMSDEFVLGMQGPEDMRHGLAARAILNVARENPDAFRLLMVHAAREPQFAELALQFRKGGVDFAQSFIGELIPDPTVRTWAARTIVRYLVGGVLEWLDVGDPARDDEFVELSSQGLIGMFLAWAPEP